MAELAPQQAWLPRHYVYMCMSDTTRRNVSVNAQQVLNQFPAHHHTRKTDPISIIQTDPSSLYSLGRRTLARNWNSPRNCLKLALGAWITVSVAHSYTSSEPPTPSPCSSSSLAGLTVRSPTMCIKDICLPRARRTRTNIPTLPSLRTRRRLPLFPTPRHTMQPIESRRS